MAVIHGIQVYEILEKGNILNGIYTNTELFESSTIHYIDNEIARRINYDENDNKGVEGSYDCSYIETDVQGNKASATRCILEIEKRKGVYKFTWSTNGKVKYTGIGLMSGTTHISVSYIKV